MCFREQIDWWIRLMRRSEFFMLVLSIMSLRNIRNLSDMSNANRSELKELKCRQEPATGKRWAVYKLNQGACLHAILLTCPMNYICTYHDLGSLRELPIAHAYIFLQLGYQEPSSNPIAGCFVAQSVDSFYVLVHSHKFTTIENGMTC